MTQQLDVAAFRGLIDGARIPCELCDWKGHALGTHLETTHDLTVQQYKEKYPKAKVASRLVVELVKSMPRRIQRTANLSAFAVKLAVAIKEEEGETELAPAP